MISVVMPFWERQKAWNKALRVMAEVYPKLDMEVVCVSDGCSCIQEVETPWPVRIIRLPEKSRAMNPCVPLNIGVQAARGEYIVLTSPEIIHRAALLEAMREEILRGGPSVYVQAAVWCADDGRWHSHSSVAGCGDTPMPPGSCLHFLTMLHRELWDKVGGFDEAYRDGVAFEDNDFVWRLQKANAIFVSRDDLIADHPHNEPRSVWDKAGLARNRELFQSKWNALTVVCVQTGNYLGRGEQYVRALNAQLAEHLSIPYRFICVTDQPLEGIECIPAEIDGWWEKLRLFKPGVLPRGRKLFLDLDTIILGNIDDLASYKGPFATLRNFYIPEGIGPAVILWDEAPSIWEEWAAQGFPRHEGGDQYWMQNLDQGRFAKSVDRLQDLFPGAFVSYKADCENGPPKDAKVVCFHGLPRPHEVEDSWVDLVWRQGKVINLGMKSVPNVSDWTMQDNILAACKLDIPWLEKAPPNEQIVTLVGGGPSVKHNLGEIYERQQAGQLVVSLNGSYHFLVRRGITPDWQVVMDARPDNLKFVAGVKPRVGILLSSQCHPALFSALNGVPATLFHNYTSAAIGLVRRTAHFVGGGNTVGLAAMAAFFSRGHRNFALYGYDSSYDETQHHAYAQALNNNERVIEATVAGRTFKTAGWMVAQVEQFQELAILLANADCVITVHGEGLLPTVAREMAKQLQGEQ